MSVYHFLRSNLNSNKVGVHIYPIQREKDLQFEIHRERTEKPVTLHLHNH